MTAHQPEGAEWRLRRRSRAIQWRRGTSQQPDDQLDSDHQDAHLPENSESSSAPRHVMLQDVLVVEMDESQFELAPDVSPPDTPSITQFINPSSTIQYAKRASVVTVYTTETADPSTLGGYGAAPKSSSLPIGIIVGSIAVGVLLAVVIVGGYIYWGKNTLRPDRNSNKNNQLPRPWRSQPRLAVRTPTSSGAKEKYSVSPASSSRPGSQRSSSRDGIPTLALSPATPTPPSDHNAPEKDILVSVSPVRSSSLPSPHSKQTLGLPSPITEKEPLAETSPSNRTSAGKSYTPQRPSPLANGADRAKAKERAKINEWASPLGPESSTRSKGSTHSGSGEALSSDGGDHQMPPVLTTGPPANGQQRLHPVTSGSSPQSGATTVVGSPVLPSHQHKKSTSDGSATTGSSGSFSEYYMHDDDARVQSPSPPPPTRSEVAKLDTSATLPNSRPTAQPVSATNTPLPLSATISATSSTPTAISTSDWLAPRSWQQSPRQLPTPSPTQHAAQPPNAPPIPPSSKLPPSNRPSPTIVPLVHPPHPTNHPVISTQAPPSAWTQNHQASTPDGTGAGGGARALSRTSEYSLDTFYTGEENHHIQAPGANMSSATITNADDYYEGNDIRESMIGVAYGGDEPLPQGASGHRSFAPISATNAAYGVGPAGRRRLSPKTS